MDVKQFRAEWPYRLNNVELKIEEMRAADSSEGLRRSWEEFLSSFGIAIGYLIDIAVSKKEIKAWGYKLKNASERNDEGLVFLREARNHVQHGLTPFAEFHNPALSYGNLFRISSGTITIQDCYATGPGGLSGPLDNFSMRAKNGKIESFYGSGKHKILAHPASVKLNKIVNTQKRIEVCVPKTIDGRNLKAGEPIDLAVAALDFLKARGRRLQEISALNIWYSSTCVIR